MRTKNEVARPSESRKIETVRARSALFQAMTGDMANPAYHPTTRAGRIGAIIRLMIARYGAPEGWRHGRLGATVIRAAQGLLKSGRADRLGEVIRCEERLRNTCARLDTQTRSSILQAWRQLSKRIEEAMRASGGDLQKVAGAMAVTLVRSEHRNPMDTRTIRRKASDAMMRSALIAEAPKEAGTLIEALQEWWNTVHPQHQTKGPIRLREAARDALFRRRTVRNAMSRVWRKIANAGMEAAFATAHAHEHHDTGTEIERIAPEHAELLETIAHHGNIPRIIDEPHGRAKDGAPVFAPVGTYPFDPKNEMFDEDRERPTGQGGTLKVKNANQATREWIEHNACVIPVLCDQNGDLKQSPSGIALAEAVRTGWDSEWAALEAAEGHAERKEGMERRLHHVKGRIVIAGWDADRGVVVACKPAGNTLSRLGELAAGRTNVVFDIARDAQGAPIHTDPEQAFDAETGLGLAPPTPGDPIFVVPANLTSPERDEAAYSAPVIEGPHASDGIHAQCIALAVAGRLGGTRDIAVMTKGVGQGALLKSAWKKGMKYPAAINLPVHCTMLTLMAQGLPDGIRIVSHRGAPAGAHHDLFQPSIEDSVHHFGRTVYPTKDDNDFQWPKGGPIAGLSAMCEELAERKAAPEGHPEHVLAHNTASDPGRTREVHGKGAEAVTRIALLMTATTPQERDRIGGTIYAIRHMAELEGCARHHDLLIPETGDGAHEMAEHVRKACDACYATHGRTPSVTVRIHPGLPIEPEQCDLVIVGPIDPRTPQARWMMNAIARAFETGVPVVRADTKSFNLDADGTVAVWASPANRRHALGWSGNALYQTRGAKSAVAILMKHARTRETKGTVAIGLEEGTLPIIQIPHTSEPFTPYPINRRRQAEAFKIVDALYGNAARALRSAVETPPAYTPIAIRPGDDANNHHTTERYASRSDIMLPAGKATAEQERGTTTKPHDDTLDLDEAVRQLELAKQRKALHVMEGEGYER